MRILFRLPPAASRTRWLNSCCCAAIWISRHSRRSRAPTPAGSRCCTRSMRAAHQLKRRSVGSVDAPFSPRVPFSPSCFDLARAPRPALPRLLPGSRLHPGCQSPVPPLRAAAGAQAQSSQLPRQVIGQSRRLGEKVLKRGLLAVLILRLRAIARDRDNPGSTIRNRSPRMDPSVRPPALRLASRHDPAVSLRSSRPATSSSIGTDSSISSRTGFSTISASIISFSSSLFSARTLTICIRPGVRTWRCDTLNVNFGCSSAINGTRSPL